MHIAIDEAGMAVFTNQSRPHCSILLCYVTNQSSRTGCCIPEAIVGCIVHQNKTKKQTNAMQCACSLFFAIIIGSSVLSVFWYFSIEDYTVVLLLLLLLVSLGFSDGEPLCVKDGPVPVGLEVASPSNWICFTMITPWSFISSRSLPLDT